jgi:hypothetical protein
MTDQSVLGKCLIFIPKNGNFEVYGTVKGKKKAAIAGGPSLGRKRPRRA